MSVDPSAVVRELVAAYAAGDRERLRSLLAPDVVAYVTNADAGIDRVDGPDAYLARLPDGTGAGLSLRVTQSVEVTDDTALTMVQVTARRDERDLHNFAAFLCRVRDGKIVEAWMVDALPAYSDEFWS